ncbi:MAG: SDR family oxidoreductase [Thermoleophilaceae bacterium]|nr:SDR family oxidoreductase [Thermoleophilaceae bacterium]
MSVQSVPSSQPAPSAQSRVVLITGGGGGIGQAVAQEFAALGHTLAIADKDTQKAAATATTMSGAGANTIWVEMDVTEQSSVQRALSEIQQRLGLPTIFVNCAGWDAAIPLAKSDESHWRKMIDINLTGAIRVTQMVLPGMIQSRWGRIVHVTGEVGRVGAANRSLMAAANGGLVAFTKSVALEVVANGITVNAVSPGHTATPMLDEMISQSEDAAEMIGELTRSIPLGRLGNPHDIAPAITFLASEGAGYITGQALSVSGGMTT